MKNDTIISLYSVSKTFHEGGKHTAAIEDITLSVTEGEFFVFLGPSGSGKSTILRIMSGLEKTHLGKLAFGSGVSGEQVSFVFQQFAIWPWLTVAENIGTGLVAQHKDPRQNVARELMRLGLVKFANSYPRELSGGMKQRVGIARALATDPKIIFMDEPFSELDSFTAAALRKEILAIWLETKPTIVMVTHLIQEAIELADRIAVLTARPGKIEKIVENNLPRPRAPRSREFFAMEDSLYRLIKP